MTKALQIIFILLLSPLALAYPDEDQRNVTLKGTRNTFHLLAETETYPILFHCSAGKDRTGILTALDLTRIDITREQQEAVRRNLESS